MDRYRAMFRKYIKLAPEIAETANEFTDWAYKNLRRDDRIVWYLRWARLGLFMNTIWSGHSIVPASPEKQARDAELEPIAKKDLEHLAKSTNITQQQADMAITTAIGKPFRQQLKHYLDMMRFIPALQNFVWGYQTPEQLVAQLGEIEQDWQTNRPDDARGMKPTEESYDNAEKIMEFPDGMAWWNLGVGGCPIEAKSMGHCGNGMGRPGEKILSLRKRMNIAGEMQDVPFLTFILDKRGYLGEMKGRNNDKPVPRYHPYIVALLEAPEHKTGITGIKGGGYKPENNFSLKDLDEQTRERLLVANPNLLTLGEKIERFGITSDVVKQLRKDAYEVGVDPGYDFDIEKKQFHGKEEYAVVVGNKTARDWSQEDSDLGRAMEVWEEHNPIRPDFTYDVHDLRDVLERLPDRYQDMFLKDIGLDRSRGSIQKLLGYVARNIEKSRYHDLLLDAIKRAGPETGEMRPKEKKELLRYMQMLMNYPFSHSQVYHRWENGSTEWNGDPDETVTYYVPLDTFVDTVDELLKFTDDENDMPDNEFYREAREVKDSPDIWLAMDSYNYQEDRDNVMQGYDSNIADTKEDVRIFRKWSMLLDSKAKKKRDALAASRADHKPGDPIKKPSSDDFTFDPIDAASILVKLLDHPRMEMPGPDRMDRMIESLRRRAGIR